MTVTYEVPRYPVVAGDALKTRVLHDFDEMPTLRLTTAQAMRLWDRDRSTCQKVLDILVEAGFLCVDAEGQYGRRPAEQCSGRICSPCMSASDSHYSEHHSGVPGDSQEIGS